MIDSRQLNRCRTINKFKFYNEMTAYFNNLLKRLVSSSALMFERKFLPFSCLIFSSLSPFSQAYAFNSYFDTQIAIEPCPEYAYGGVTVNVFYRIAGVGDLIPAQIVSSTFDSNANLFKPVIRLPATYSTTKFVITSTCTSTSQGTSKESNIMQLSNCDKLAKYDSDSDGITNDREDLNCDNSFSPGDFSNPNNIDTDGDGVADLVESVSNTDPTNPGSSPRPFIYSATTFDTNSDGVSDPVVWRPQTGTWFIKTPSAVNSFPFGQQGDIPLTYRDTNHESNVGVIRRNNTRLIWFLKGLGFSNTAGISKNSFEFGIFGDNIILGPWEKSGITNPAVARLVNGVWEYYILLSTGSIKQVTFGGNGDLLKPQDFDGDGIFDLAVYRPSTQTTYVKQSSNGLLKTYNFGTGTADFTVRGDYTGDGKEELSFWEPSSGLFTSLTSENGINPTQGALKNPSYYKELQLGEYFNDLPLCWNNNGSRNLHTVINHSTGIRKFYPNNDRNQPLQSIQLGLYGDFQG